MCRRSRQHRLGATRDVQVDWTDECPVPARAFAALHLRIVVCPFTPWQRPLGKRLSLETLVPVGWLACWTTVIPHRVARGDKTCDPSPLVARTKLVEVVFALVDGARPTKVKPSSTAVIVEMVLGLQTPRRD
jgi:hypothetical protein